MFDAFPETGAADHWPPTSSPSLAGLNSYLQSVRGLDSSSQDASVSDPQLLGAGRWGVAPPNGTTADSKGKV